MPDQAVTPLLLSREATAKLMSCCTRTVDAMIRSGELPAVRLGKPGVDKKGRAIHRAVRIDINDLRAWIEQQKHAAGVAR